MATLLAHVTVRPGAEARFEEIARELWERTHADEPAVRHYEYWRGSDSRTYYTLVSYPDHRSFISHQASDHHESAVHQLGDVVEHIRLEWLDPVEGASDLPPTAMQSAPPDADDLVRSHTDRYAAVIAAWWPARPIER
ncbi:MAG: antibiotic biosynthesis monooxygenase [Ilumatobacteraceae bacterium]|nr:antibiotic biosynthesis monooxygenase [Ilumatobacteraceae bacterium]